MNQQSKSKRALIFVNRHARQGGDKLNEALEQLEKLGFDLIEKKIKNAEQIPTVISQQKDQVDLVIIGGGDGTLNAAVEGLVDAQLPLGILPLGTANDLARTLGIPTTLPEACQVIANGNMQRIDLGWVNGKYFFNVASLGLSVKITRQLTKDVKQKWGVFAYAITAGKAVWESRPFHASIRINGEEPILVKALQIAVGNGRYYGGGMTVAEDAAIDDRRLDLYTLETKHWWHIVALMPAMKQGNHASWPGVRGFQGQEIEITTYNKKRSINTDGEITTTTPATFRVIPQALPVYVP
jgi:diacylglycerol kinase (ATP)